MTRSIFQRIAAVAAVALMTLALLPILSSAALAQPSNSEIAEGIEDAMLYARTLPDAFGGVWITDDGAVFAFTHRATDEQVADVIGRVRSGIPVTTVRVDWSEAEPRAAKDAISPWSVRSSPWL